MVLRKSNVFVVCPNRKVCLCGQVDGIVKGGCSVFAVREDGESKNFTRNFLEHDERGIGHFEEGFEFSGLIPRGLGGKSGLARVPGGETRVKTWRDSFFSGSDLIGFETYFNGQILGDNIKKGKRTFGDFLSKSCCVL